MEEHPISKIVGVFKGSAVTDNFFLYWVSTFADLLLTLLSLVIFYNTAKSLIATFQVGGGLKYPINLYKSFVLCMSAVVFLRVAPDTAIMLMWKEVSSNFMAWLQHFNQVFDTIALLPFFLSLYVLLRAGPLIEFQLLRQPIPTNLWPSWRMIRQPIISVVLMVLLSLLIVSTKLAW